MYGHHRQKAAFLLRLFFSAAALAKHSGSII